MKLKRFLIFFTSLSTSILMVSSASAHSGHGELGLLHHVLGGDYWFVAVGIVVLIALALTSKHRS